MVNSYYLLTSNNVLHHWISEHTLCWIKLDQNVSFFPPTEDVVIHEFATLCLAHMAVEYTTKVKIFEQGGLEPLIRLLGSPDPDVKKNSVECLYLLVQVKFALVCCLKLQRQISVCTPTPDILCGVNNFKIFVSFTPQCSSMHLKHWVLAPESLNVKLVMNISGFTVILLNLRQLSVLYCSKSKIRMSFRFLKLNNNLPS